MNFKEEYQSKSFFVRENHALKRVEIANVVYIQAEGNYSFIVEKTGEKHVSKISLRQFLSRFENPPFIRVHKSYLVNLAFVENVDVKNKEINVNGEKFPIGRTFSSDLLESLHVI